MESWREDFWILPMICQGFPKNAGFLAFSWKTYHKWFAKWFSAMNAKYAKLGIISPVLEGKLNKFETFGVKYPEDLITISTTHPNRCLLWSTYSECFQRKRKNSNITWILCSVQPEVEIVSYDCDCDWDLHCRKTHVGIRQVRTFTYICVDEGPDPYPWSGILIEPSWLSWRSKIEGVYMSTVTWYTWHTVASCKITRQASYSPISGWWSIAKQKLLIARHLTGKMAIHRSFAHHKAPAKYLIVVCSTPCVLYCSWIYNWGCAATPLSSVVGHDTVLGRKKHEKSMYSIRTTYTQHLHMYQLVDFTTHK